MTMKAAMEELDSFENGQSLDEIGPNRTGLATARAA